MRIGFCHCWLFPGGGKSVFIDIIRRTETSQAFVFTLISYDRFLDVDGKKLRVITALPFWLCQFFAFCEHKKIPILSSLFDYRNLMPFYPLLIWILSWKVSRYHLDGVVLSSFAVMKNLSFDGKKILYLHSPMQYLRENYQEYVHKLKGFKKWLFIFSCWYLKKRDKQKRYYDTIYANSVYTQKVAHRIYHLESQVAYPLVHNSFLDVIPQESQEYYVFIGRVVKFVRECDLIIRAFNALGWKLLIIGDGPDSNELKHIAHPNIHFLGYIDSVDEKIDLIARAKGSINIAKESFGIATVETLLCGCPVFGYDQGGTQELLDSKSGFLVSSKSLHNIIDKLKEFDTMHFDRNSVQNAIRSKLDTYPFPRKILF